MARGRQSEIPTAQLQITVDSATLIFLDLIVKTGRYGRSRNDAAAAILREWLPLNATAVAQDLRQKLKEAEEAEELIDRYVMSPVA